jgi:hypothetical protein
MSHIRFSTPVDDYVTVNKDENINRFEKASFIQEGRFWQQKGFKIEGLDQTCTRGLSMLLGSIMV